jgi:hypothetical protein
MSDFAARKGEITLVDPEAVIKLRVPQKRIGHGPELRKILFAGAAHKQSQFAWHKWNFIQKIDTESQVRFEGCDFP